MRDYGTTNNTPAHQAPPVWRAPEGLEDLTAAQVGDGGACQHTNDKPDRSGAPRGLRGLAGHHTDTPTDWRPPRGLRGLAAVPVGGGRAWPGFEKTRRANHQHTRLHWCGGHRRELPRCRWAAAGPSQASRSTTLNRLFALWGVGVVFEVSSPGGRGQCCGTTTEHRSSPWVPHQPKLARNLGTLTFHRYRENRRISTM
mgnify:FL=1